MGAYPYPPQGQDPNTPPPPAGYGASPPGYGPPPGAPPKKSVPTWLIALIVVGGLFVLCGFVMVPLAIYGVRKYIANAKSVEARASLAQIGKDALLAYERGTVSSHNNEVVHRMCPSASASVPATIAAVKGMKYQSSPGEWEVDAARNGGFACLKFSLGTPQYYLYRYTAHGSSRPGDSFVAEADGDLSGDGTLTTYRTTGRISESRALEITSVPSGP